MKPILTLLLAAALITPAHAGAEPAEPARLQLTASARQSLKNDHLLATLYLEREDRSSEALMAAIRQGLAQAERITQAYPDVKVETAGVSTHPLYDERRIRGWRARAELSLEGPADGRITQLLTELQSILVVGHLQPQVSPQAEEAARETLALRAIEAFRSKADAYANAFGAPGWQVGAVQVDAGSAPPMRPYAGKVMSMTMEAAAPEMPVATGETTLTVQVSGHVLLEAP